MVKNLPANIRDKGLIPGSEDPLEEDTATHSSILTWEIPWTESLVGYSPWGRRESDMTEHTAHTQIIIPAIINENGMYLSGICCCIYWAY